MTRQLNRAFPAHTYPVVTVTPDGGLIMSAGKTLVRAGAALPTVACLPACCLPFVVGRIACCVRPASHRPIRCTSTRL